jgi:CubicO group peptidase (beta-lactamase class C family)
VRPAGLVLGGALLLTSACAPEPVEAPAPAALVLDCAQGFDVLSAKIAAEPGLTRATAPGEPYRYYNAADGHVSYVVTEPGGAGHPAIVRQTATPAGMVEDGCPYGDKSGYDELVAYLRSLAKVRGQ